LVILFSPLAQKVFHIFFLWKGNSLSGIPRALHSPFAMETLDKNQLLYRKKPRHKYDEIVAPIIKGGNYTQRLAFPDTIERYFRNILCATLTGSLIEVLQSCTFAGNGMMANVHSFF